MRDKDVLVITVMVIAAIALGAVVGSFSVMSLLDAKTARPKISIDPAEVKAVADRQTAQERAKTDAERIMSAPSFLQALVWAKPYMYDRFEEVDAGSMMLALWATQHLRWEEVLVKKNQATLPQLLADVERERGRALCARGRVTLIQADPLIGRAVRGFIDTTGYGEVAFVAPVATGVIREGLSARICGVFTGVYSYEDDDSIQKRAIKVVGMFEFSGKGEAL